MEVKKGYKQTDVGVIPDDWELKSVGEIAGISTGTKNTQDRIEDGLYPFFVRSQTVERINSYSFDGEAVLTAGDGVGTGKVFHYIHGRFDYHQRVYSITNFNESVVGYFFFLYFSNNFYNRIMQMTAKSSVDSVRMEMIAKMKIPLPPYKEQTAIATALSDADALISSLEKLIAKKRNIKQGVMQQLLQPKEGWDFLTYGEIFTFLNTATYSRAELSVDEEIGYVHYGDIHTRWNYFLDLTNTELPSISINQAKAYSLVEDGDVIMADASEDYSGIGKCIEIKNIKAKKLIAGLHTFLLRDKKGVFINGFKGYLHASAYIKNQFDKLATGMKVYGVSKTNLKSVIIPVPPKHEQSHIASILSDMEEDIAILEKKLRKYRRIKQGMMEQLLTGKIRLV